MSNSVFRLARNDGCVPLGEHGKMASQQNSLSLTHREQLNFATISLPTQIGTIGCGGKCAGFGEA